MFYIPLLNEKQWKFIEERLSKPASLDMQRRLKEAIINSKRIKFGIMEETPENIGKGLKELNKSKQEYEWLNRNKKFLKWNRKLFERLAKD